MGALSHEANFQQDANLPSLYSGEDVIYGMRGRFRTQHVCIHACVHTEIQNRDKVVAEGGQRMRTVRVYGVSHLGPNSEKYSVTDVYVVYIPTENTL